MSAPNIIDWLSAGGNLITAVAVATGVFIAWKQLSIWKNEAVTRRRAEVAEGLLSAAYNVDDILRSLRSPFDSIPIEEKDNPRYIYEQRYKRFVERSEDFAELRRAEVRAFPFFQHTTLKDVIAVFYKVRADAMIAIDMLSSRTDLAGEDQDTREMYAQMRHDMYGSYSARDVLGQKQIAAMKALEEMLLPAIRLER